MKRIALAVSVIMMGIVSSFAQRENIAPEIQAGRDMMAIERKMERENTDPEATKLIKEHTKAKARMDGTMKKLPGYGKAATSKEDLEKFREKSAKKDPEFQKLSDDETAARKAKEDYISGVDDNYKKLRAITNQ